MRTYGLNLVACLCTESLFGQFDFQSKFATRTSSTCRHIHKPIWNQCYQSATLQKSRGSSLALSTQTNTTPTALPTLMVSTATSIHQQASTILMVQAIHTVRIAQRILMAWVCAFTENDNLIKQFEVLYN